MGEFAEREPYRDFLLLGGGPREHKMREVGAGDEEYQSPRYRSDGDARRGVPSGHRRAS